MHVSARSRDLASHARSGEGEHAILVKKKAGVVPAASAGLRGPRRLALITAALLLATLGLAVLDLAREQSRRLETGDASMRELARVADALWLADEARIHALLARLRVELRIDERWSVTRAAGDAPVAGAADQASFRRTDTLLRRALEGAGDVRSIDLIVAGQDGVVSLRVEPEAGPQAGPQDESELEARARALWYSDVVQQAVEAKGRRVTRTSTESPPVEVEGGGRVRAVIALHDADEVVQGVLVATIDLAPLATRLASLASRETRFALVTPSGTPIGEPAQEPTGEIEKRLADARSAKESVAPIVVDAGLRSLLQRPTQSVDGAPEAYFWLERDPPPSLARAALGSPWLVALAALALLAAALLAWDRDRSAARATVAVATPAPAVWSARSERAESALFAAADPGPRAGGGFVAGGGEGGGAPGVRPERFVLRDWLADVRGCLEREAATRGLTLDLRCERSLPREVEQDPLWLGGLLVSLGREALDATSASRVALEVTEDRTEAGGSGLRFELDAGDSELEAVTGMNVIAGRLGATLEGRGRGRLSVFVPGSNA